MAGISLLTPLLLLGLGAGAVVASGHRAALGGRLPAVLASLALVAGLPLLILPPRRLVLSRWTMEPLPPLALSLQSDALSTPFLLVILLVTAVGFSMFDLQLPIDGSRKKRQSAGWLLLAAAGVAFVLAGDPLTLYVAWVLIDLAIFAVVYFQTAQTDLDQPIRALRVNAVLGLPLLMAAVTVAPGMSWARGSGQWWPALAIAALLVAAGARLGVYPAPFRLPGTHLGGALGRPFLELITVTCGAYLSLRSLLLAGGALPLGVFWSWLALLAIAVAGFLAWWGDAPALGPILATTGLTHERAGTSEDKAHAAVSWITAVQAGWFFLAAGLPGLPRAVAVLQAFTLCLAPALLRLWLALGFRPATRRGLLWVHSLGWLAVANLLGVPPTLGFVARWALYRHLVEGGAWHLLILLSAATALTVPPLLRLMRAGGQRSGGAEAQGRAVQVSSAPLLNAYAQVMGVSLVGLVLLLIGLQPLLLLAPLQMLMSTASLYLEQLVRGVNSAVGLAIVLALLLPVLAGYGLTLGEVAARLPLRWYPGDAQIRLRQQVQTALSLEWTYRVVEQGAWRLGTMVRTLLTPLEGEWYWGWTFLFALLTALLVLSG